MRPGARVPPSVGPGSYNIENKDWKPDPKWNPKVLCCILVVHSWVGVVVVVGVELHLFYVPLSIPYLSSSNNNSPVLVLPFFIRCLAF